MPRQRYVERSTVNPAAGPNPKLEKWTDRADKARRDRKRYEPTWQLCQSYLAGRQWVGWLEREQRLISLETLDEWKHRELHTVNITTPFVWNMLARVMSDDLMPDISFRREDIESDLFAKQARQAWGWAWDEEVRGMEQVKRVLLKEFTFGTAAMRCLYDQSVGPVIGEFPVDPNTKQPVLDPQAAQQLVASAMMAGQNLQFREIREGRNVWEPLSPFNLLPPPGVQHEDDFPWLIVCRPVSIERIKSMFGNAAANKLNEEPLKQVDAVGTMDASGTNDPFSVKAGDLEDHVLLYTGYEMPCPDYPDGYTCIWAQDQILAEMNKLPHVIDGIPHHGIVFFHYHRVEGRFWSQGIVEKAIGPQRQINRARSQMIEMKDRNLGRVYARRGTIHEANEPVGKIMELIEVDPGHDFPFETQGTAPGPWIQAEAEISRQDLDMVLGVSEVSRGFAPQGVAAYSALSLLVEQSEKSIEPIIREARKGITMLGKLTLSNIRRFWTPNRLIAVAGSDGMMEAFAFTAAQLPESIYIVWPQGAPRPKSQAGEIQKIFDLFDRSVASGRPLPLEWLKRSLDNAKAEEVPEQPGQAQQGKAEMENMLLARGQMVYPANYDDDMLHIQIHRAAQTAQDLMPGSEQVTALFEQHIQYHVFNNQQKMMMAAQTGALNHMLPQLQQPGQPGQPGGDRGLGAGPQTAQRGPTPATGGGMATHQ